MRAFVDWLASTPLSRTFVETSWLVPTMQTFHIMAIAIVVSSVLMIDLRVLGWAGRGQTLRATVDRFAPWLWGALVVLAATGSVLIITEPARQLMSISFWVKMSALAVGLVVAFAFARSLRRNETYWEESRTVKARTKAFGVATLLVWVCVIFLGRFIAYDPQIWGALSPLAY